MSDLALRWDLSLAVADLAVEANDLARDAGMQTAVMLSLFTDRRAEAGDVLPVGETDRRGWWADAAPVVEQDKIGSRLWLLAREKATETTRRRAEQFAREALQWLIDDRVASKVEAVASFLRRDEIALVITIQRPQGDAVIYRFDHVWGSVDPESATVAPAPLDLAPGDAFEMSSGVPVVDEAGTYLTE